MTWLYALVQLIDIRFWRSAAARKRRVAMGIPGESHRVAVSASMIPPWFGIIYYGFTEDPRLVSRRTGGIAADIRSIPRAARLRRTTVLKGRDYGILYSRPRSMLYHYVSLWTKPTMHSASFHTARL
jgi:hypothetical protein